MPWKEVKAMNQKEAFVKKASLGQGNFSALCREYGITRPTGYKLLERFKKEGLSGLQQNSRNSINKPNKTPAYMEEKIIALRARYPTWGARKIHHFLAVNGISKLPSRDTINEILKRNGLISREASLQRKKFTRFEHEAPNDLWQIDFKGAFTMQNQERCFPLTILDDHSRFSLDIRGCLNEQFVTVKSQLIKVFEHYGLPSRINADNGNPWGTSSGVQHTHLTVWLMQLGIRVSHSRPKHPQTNGKIERFHRSLKEDVILRSEIVDLEHAQRLFDEWRETYNHVRPHEGIGMLVPAKRYQSSLKIMPQQLPPIEYNEGAQLRKVRSRGDISYGHKLYFIGKAFKGYYLQVKPDEIKGEIKFYFGKHRVYTDILI